VANALSDLQIRLQVIPMARRAWSAFLCRVVHRLGISNQFIFYEVIQHQKGLNSHHRAFHLSEPARILPLWTLNHYTALGAWSATEFIALEPPDTAIHFQRQKIQTSDTQGS
jgi:hypothetical protein